MSLLSTVTKSAPSSPSRIYLYAQEKWGKTSWAAYAPDAIFVMTEGETGLLTLLEAGRVPEVAHFPDDARSWKQLLDFIRAVRDEQHTYKTLVLDTSNGAERLLAQHILENDYGGVMSGKDGFASYGKGHEACIPEWTKFLRLLDDIRNKRKMSIILLAHSKIKSVNNPEGSDYDQLRPEGIDKLWTLTHKWADAIICGTHDVFVKDDKVKNSKGRQIRTSGSVAVIAGNRYGLPETIPCGADAKSAWNNFFIALRNAKQAGKKPETPPVGNNAPTNNPPKGNDGGTTTPPTTDPKPTPSNNTQTPPVDNTPATGEYDDAAYPGDGYEPENATTPAQSPEPQATFNNKLPDAIARSLVAAMNEKELTWPTVKKQLPEILGPNDRIIGMISELTLEEASVLSGWLKAQAKPKAKKAEKPEKAMA